MARGDGEPDPIDVAVGARMRIRRKELRMSQAELAERLGVSFQQVQKYERGANRVSASMLVRAAHALDCPAGALLGEDQEQALDAEFLSMLATNGAIELLRAFVQIPDNETRSAVLAIAKGLAAPDAPARRPVRPSREGALQD